MLTEGAWCPNYQKWSGYDAICRVLRFRWLEHCPRRAFGVVSHVDPLQRNGVFHGSVREYP
jgi:hypothetical protein